MNVRTIRKLDWQPGEATETRQVQGVTVEKGVPFKSFHNGLHKVLEALQPGESFVWHTYPSFRRDRFPGKRFEGQKLPDGKKYRVWRLA